MRTPIKVFVTYTWDTEEHRARVRGLAASLVSHGIDCNIDAWDQTKAQGLPRWMQQHLAAADFVLCVCTESYCRRVEGREVAGKGLGANFEGKLINAAIMKAGAENTKFIPAVFEKEDVKHIPDVLSDATYYLLTDDVGYEALYRRLTDQPKDAAPRLGKMRPLKTEVADPIFNLPKRAVSKHSDAGKHGDNLVKNPSVQEETEIPPGTHKALLVECKKGSTFVAEVESDVLLAIAFTTARRHRDWVAEKIDIFDMDSRRQVEYANASVRKANVSVAIPKDGLYAFVLVNDSRKRARKVTWSYALTEPPKGKRKP